MPNVMEIPPFLIQTRYQFGTFYNGCLFLWLGSMYQGITTVFYLWQVSLTVQVYTLYSKSRTFPSESPGINLTWERLIHQSCPVLHFDGRQSGNSWVQTKLGSWKITQKDKDKPLLYCCQENYKHAHGVTRGWRTGYFTSKLGRIAWYYNGPVFEHIIWYLKASFSLRLLFFLKKTEVLNLQSEINTEIVNWIDLVFSKQKLGRLTDSHVALQLPNETTSLIAIGSKSLKWDNPLPLITYSGINMIFCWEEFS